VLDNRYFGLRDFDRASYPPPSAGSARLIDGTVIQVAGEKTASGDPIGSEIEIDGHSVSVDAIGVVAVRLDACPRHSRDGRGSGSVCVSPPRPRRGDGRDSVLTPSPSRDYMGRRLSREETDSRRDASN
jgi:hypothetical protein